MTRVTDRLPAVALGYQGFGNVGDEAILAGIEELLAGTPIDVIAVITGPRPVGAFPAAQRLPTRRLRPTLAAVRALRRARLLLISGGGLLHDHWATVVPTYLGWVLIARALGVHVCWLGVGVGPLRSWWARRLSAVALRLSALVTVRDAESARLVGEIAPGVRVETIPDPAVFVPLGTTATKRDAIGIVVRRPVPRDAAATERLAGALGGALAALQASGMRAELLTVGGPADAPFAAQVAERAVAAGSPEAHLDQLAPDPRIVLARLAGFEALISVRLHGVILGALVGTPSVSVAYDPKVEAWATRLGLSDYCVPMSSLSSEAVVAALDRLRTSEKAAAQLAERVAGLRGEAGAVRELLMTVA